MVIKSLIILILIGMFIFQAVSTLIKMIKDNNI